MTSRSESIDQIIKLLQSLNCFIISSPPMTGKTSLIQLLKEHLVKNGYTVIAVTLMRWDPVKTNLDNYWVQECGYTLNHLISPGMNFMKHLVILIDEFQMIYPDTNIQSTYPGISDPQLVIQDVNKFISMFKSIQQQRQIGCICFAGYGENKKGHLLSTPVSIPKIEQNFARFTREEINELYQDFTNRTQVYYINKNGLSVTVRKHIEQLTNAHVGFMSCILHTFNFNHNQIKDEESLLTFLYSYPLAQVVQAQRILPEWDSLSEEYKEVLKDLWVKGDAGAPFHSHALYSIFVKKGWIYYDEGNVKLFCPIIKQLWLNNITACPRPSANKVDSLEQLLDKFFSRVTSQDLKGTLSVGCVEEVLEQQWRIIFYRYACQLISNKSYINSEAKAGKGKVDFYIDGALQWAIEFVIRGERVTAGLKDHIKRFMTHGKYAELPKKESAVVDFRQLDLKNTPSIEFKMETELMVWIIEYDINFSHLWVTIFQGNVLKASRKQMTIIEEKL